MVARCQKTIGQMTNRTGLSHEQKNFTFCGWQKIFKNKYNFTSKKYVAKSILEGFKKAEQLKIAQK